ncbi:enoyl-[acyl-carrier-protein] reductase FabK [Peptostreptococcaceae bacterium AGR-M142]
MNRLCEILDIKYPIIQGGMAWIATAELAAAVSNAGGLGIIGAGNAPADIVEKEIIKAKELTNKPFGVNVMLISPFVDDIMELIIKHDIKVITTGAGNPGKYMPMLKEKDIKVIPVVPSVALAKRMQKNGADAIIVEGTEAGGHIGELSTMVLVPQICDVVDIPVVAAGGIVDGRGMAASFALGAQAVQIGTRFVCSTESIAHDNYKEAIINAKDRDAIVTGRSTGHPVRLLKNKLAKDMMKLEKENEDPKKIEELGVGSLRKAVIEGDIKDGSIMSGQVAGMINDIKTCEEIINDMINKTKEVISNLKF